MINVFILLLLIVAAGYAAFWFINQGLPEPMRMIARVIVVILALLAIWQYVLPGIA